MSTAAKSLAPVVVVGAGLGGLTVALQLAAQRQVIVLAKRELNEAATAWAAAALSYASSPQQISRR